ncbi:lysophospholipid acyltransferase family protein [Clostridium sp. D33t1_170424_F3]|uniref:lysophospholipid acyltransferase family protein n=1 Tax=Clostridium sp. D33t1_170424_F3 TaxID=2787099 RepID=UPI0018AC1802
MTAYQFWKKALYPLGRLLYRLHFEGTENIPLEGPFIICCNHRSVIDPFFLALPVKRQIRYMAKSELFTDHGSFVKWLLYRFGAFPVMRDKGDAESVRTAVQILQDHGVVGIFPQGRCVSDNSPFRPKAGAVLVAAKAKAPILPACIYCEGLVKPFKRIVVRFGELIPFEGLNLPDGSLKGVREASGLLAEKINLLLDKRDAAE